MSFWPLQRRRETCLDARNTIIAVYASRKFLPVAYTTLQNDRVAAVEIRQVGYKQEPLSFKCMELSVESSKNKVFAALRLRTFQKFMELRNTNQNTVHADAVQTLDCHSL